MIRYAKPKTVDEALALLAQERWRILAGGTDFYPAQGTRPITDNVLDLNGLDGTARHLPRPPRIMSSAPARPGPTSSAPRLPPAFDALKQAAVEVGSVQIQNVGIDRRQSLQRLAGRRRRAAAAGARCRGRTALGVGPAPRCRLPTSSPATAARRCEPGELVTAIRIPKTIGRRRLRLRQARRAALSGDLDRHGAARIERDATGALRSAAVAVGSCSAVAQRLAGLESALVGRPADAGAIERGRRCLRSLHADADRRRPRQRRLPPRGGARDRARALLAALGGATSSARQAAA